METTAPQPGSNVSPAAVALPATSGGATVATSNPTVPAAVAGHGLNAPAVAPSTPTAAGGFGPRDPGGSPSKPTGTSSAAAWSTRKTWVYLGLVASALAVVNVVAMYRSAPHPATTAASMSAGATAEASAGSALTLPDMRVDLNRDPAAIIEVLPGIGPALAARIVADRDAHGPFHTLDDLRRVRGIGPKTVEGLRGQIMPLPGETNEEH